MGEVWHFASFFVFWTLCTQLSQSPVPLSRIMLLTVTPDYVPGIPIIVQFPPEILHKVLGQLDPIWLFQLEIACPQMSSFLRSRTANKVWYDAIPAALLTQPEYFQSERDVARAQAQNPSLYYNVNGIDTSQAVMPSAMQLSEKTADYNQVRDPQQLYFTIPGLAGLSSLWQDMDLSTDTKHPKQQHREQYPFIKPFYFKPRKRILALGGPIDNSIRYRRELLGNLHYGSRCYICYEVSNTQRPTTQKFGMFFCDNCLTALTLHPSIAAQIPGLPAVLDTGAGGVWRPTRLSTDGLYWIPEVDEVLRATIGIDYDTAVAKQKYFDYLHQITGREGRKSTSPDARKLRTMVVEEAKMLWSAPKLPLDVDTIKRLRESFLPAAELAKFLFPGHLLYEESIYLPHDTEAVYLEDPVSQLSAWSMREHARSPGWSVETARTMVEDLVRYKRTVTVVYQACHEWNVARLRVSLPSVTEDILSAKIVAPNNYQRLIVILEKLHLLQNPITGNVGLTPEGKKKAMKVLPSIVECACIGCPKSHMLAPRGIDSVVTHMATHHYELFWAGKFLLEG